MVIGLFQMLIWMKPFFHIEIVPHQYQRMFYLSKTIGYFGIEGGLHHVAGALKKNAIVIFGHWISPILTGYSFHNNISSSSTKYGCGSFIPCKRCIEFLNNLSSSYIKTIFEEKFLKE